MILKKTSVILTSVFFLIPLILSGTERVMGVVLPENVPLFSVKNLETAPVRVTESGFEAELLGSEALRLSKHPLARKTTLWKLKADGREFWCCPDLRAEKSFRSDYPGKIFLTYRFLPNALHVSLGGILLLFSALSVFVYFRKKENPFGQRCCFEILLPLGLVLFHAGFLLYLTGRSGVVPEPADELSYFKAAEGIASGDISGPWSYTAGWPMLESVFLFILGSGDFFVREDFLLNLNGFILMPLVLVCVYWIFRKLSGSPLKAFLTVLLWRFVSVFWHFRDFWHADKALWGSNIYKGFFAFPDFGQGYQTYLYTTAFGYNALSDTLSMLCVFSLILLALTMKPKNRNLAFFGAFFGYACLVRLNNIFFAPLYGYLLWHVYKPGLRDGKKWAELILTGLLPFLAVFSIQLWLNFRHFGDALRFPYSLHDPEVYKGFLLRYVPHGIRFLMTVNYIYFLPGLFFLIFQKDRFLRIVLTLWILPLTFFFFGYPQTCNNGIRFLLPVYAALCGSIVLNKAWGTGRKNGLVLLGILFLCTVPAAPSNYVYTKILAWNLETVSTGSVIAFHLNLLCPAAAAVLAGVFFRRERGLLIFSLIFIAVYASGCVWTAPAMMVLLLLELFIFRRNPEREINAVL